MEWKSVSNEKFAEFVAIVPALAKKLGSSNSISNSKPGFKEQTIFVNITIAAYLR